MPKDLFKRGFSLLFKRQNNILSAAFVIMATIIFSQVLGLIGQRLLVSIFGASNTLGIFLASTRLPDFLFQILIAGALSSAFIPVFSEYIVKGKEQEGHKVASSLLFLSLAIFACFSLVLFIFAKPFSVLIAPGFSSSEQDLMANLTRIVIFGEILFIIGSFLSAILQSYNHFFIPGLLQLFITLGLYYRYCFPFSFCRYLFGGLRGCSWCFIFVLIQIPLAQKMGFSFKPSLSLESIKSSGVLDVLKLIWPRTISIGIFQLGTIITVTLVSFLHNPGRNYVIFDYAQTLAFAPVAFLARQLPRQLSRFFQKKKKNLRILKRLLLPVLIKCSILYYRFPCFYLF